MDLDYHNWSLDDWSKMFEGIYLKNNNAINSENLLLHIVEEVAELAEDLRKQHIEPRDDRNGIKQGVLTNIADTFAWLSAFASRYGSLGDMLWGKYPGMCPVCFVKKDCSCISYSPQLSKEERLDRLNQARQTQNNRPSTLYEWQELFDNIYGKTNKKHTIEKLGFHLMEEVGEVSKMLRKGDDIELEREVADIFAWLVGLTLKAGDSEGKEYRLDDMVWDRYPKECPHCKSNPCNELE
jgi:NTP pyrophosphatase (non-canonical NTP hydrolase)